MGDWIVSQSRGRLQSTIKQEYNRSILPTYIEARTLVLTLNKQQRKLGYKTMGITETQLGFQFD